MVHLIVMGVDWVLVKDAPKHWALLWVNSKAYQLAVTTASM